MIRKIESISNERIALQWDAAAPIRFHEISSGADHSYTNVLMPFFKNILENDHRERLLDVGCGLGFITKLSSHYAKSTVGVDISKESLRYAEKYNGGDNITYLASPVEDIQESKFDVAIANMVFMDCQNLDDLLRATHNLLKPSALLHAVFINPMFWPRYWGYERASWFNYQSEIIVEGEFRTSSSGRSGFLSTHVHRPLGNQLNTAIKNGFSIERLQEITGVVGNSRILRKYPRYIYLSLKNAAP